MQTEICIFKRGNCYILLYVDDFLAAARSTGELDKLATEIEKLFDIKRIGEPAKFLGFAITRDRATRHIYLNQTAFIDAMLEKYADKEIHGVATPWPLKVDIPADWREMLVVMPVKDWIKRTGSLNYLSHGTRPDITFTV